MNGCTITIPSGIHKGRTFKMNDVEFGIYDGGKKPYNLQQFFDRGMDSYMQKIMSADDTPAMLAKNCSLSWPHPEMLVEKITACADEEFEKRCSAEGISRGVAHAVLERLWEKNLVGPFSRVRYDPIEYRGESIRAMFWADSVTVTPCKRSHLPEKALKGVEKNIQDGLEKCQTVRDAAHIVCMIPDALLEMFISKRVVPELNKLKCEMEQ